MIFNLCKVADLHEQLDELTRAHDDMMGIDCNYAVILPYNQYETAERILALSIVYTIGVFTQDRLYDESLSHYVSNMELDQLFSWLLLNAPVVCVCSNNAGDYIELTLTRGEVIH